MNLSRLFDFFGLTRGPLDSGTLALAAAPRSGRCLKFFPSVVPASAFSGRTDSGVFRLSRTAGSDVGPVIHVYRAASPWLA